MQNKNTAYSILDLAIVSKGNTLAETFENSLALAQAADEVGYQRYWLAEHHNSDAIGSSATSILIGKIAEGTKRIKVGSGGIMLPNHSPLIIAEQFGTLGILYPNRIDLGLGRAPGTDRDTANAIRSDFYQAAMSFPEEVQKLQDYFSIYSGSNKVRANVAEGVNVPLYILGSSHDSAHLAAKKGLPYAFASHFATPLLLSALAVYREEFQPSEVLDAPYTLAGVNIIVADTDEEAEHISTSLYKMIIGLITGKRGLMQAPEAMTNELREMSKHPSVQQMLKYSFIGSKATVKEKVKAFIEDTQIDEIIAVTNIYDSKDRIKSYRLFAEIMQELNNEA
ncbi:LLM class flavin-dependent oxidoreductase [Tamlana sp. 2_MG-2023]|uniref:LLM class flavin-dependent oxidoreductase n=1 Tax=unclassified Tamlana TaxID=2614803 RepID=UPI0026E1E6E5|nr:MULTISPECIES: LLM class flavin-dependent oxidoreductase [unclassified Tamlana]MDO6760408.1 LLM class flavin-dependent oxidoreductase [Tamlana sp. 2_MG-2023]MDO6789893.1 LLM class flavin-dependent oxidoreductase [Tamlana sp. 1_MG-2023]